VKTSLYHDWTTNKTIATCPPAKARQRLTIDWGHDCGGREAPGFSFKMYLRPAGSIAWVTARAAPGGGTHHLWLNIPLYDMLTCLEKRKILS